MHKIIKYKFISGSLNIIILLIIFNILFMLLNLAYNNIYIYKKIFINEQNLHNKQLDLDLKLINNANSETFKLSIVGFIADDLTYLCPNGINIHEMYINHISYGYWGKRIAKKIDYDNLNIQKLYYENLITSKGFEVNKLTIVDLYNQNQIDQVFFIDQQGKLWSYDVKLNNFFLQYATDEPIINYIIGNPIFNKSLKYNIYIHHKLHTKDIIKLIYFEDMKDTYINNSKTIELFTSLQPINAIFLRANHLIAVSSEGDSKIDPIINIYKLDYNYQDSTKFNFKLHTSNHTSLNFICNKIDIKFNNLPISTSTKLGDKFELIWNTQSNYHQLNIYIGYQVISSYFRLNPDNALLSYKNIC